MSSRKRPVTSCVECYKRKQKCNRRQPCNHCTSRRIPEKCIFSEERKTLIQQSTREATRPVSKITESDIFDGISEPAVPSNLLGQVGYSSTSSNAALLHQDSFAQDQDGIQDKVCPGRPEIIQPHIRPTEAVEHDRRKEQSRAASLLPPHEVMLMLFDLYFGEATFHFMCIDEQHFRRRYDQWRGALDQANPEKSTLDIRHFPALLLQVLAQTLDCLSPQHQAAKALNLEDYGSCDRLADKFHFMGDHIMQTIGRHNPSETSVEHDLVSADWLKTSGRGAQAWNRLGSAIRQAQELGLHDLPDTIEPEPGQDVEPHLLAVWQLEHQKRLWTRLFIFDANLAMGLGRPRIIHREDAVIPTLLNCDFPYDTAKIIPVPYEDCSFASTIFLLRVAHKIHDVLSILSNRVRRDDYLAIMALHDEICVLRSTMPKFNSVGLTSVDRLRSSVSYLRLVNHINTVIIALHRPFIASQPTSRALAVSAALNQLDTQEDLFQILPFPQFKLYGNVFYTIDASVFLAGVVTELPAQDLDTYRQIQESIQKAIARLKVMKQRNRIAGLAEEMLRHFYDKMEATQSASTTRVDQGTRDSSGMDDSAVDNIIATISPLQQHSFETYESLFNFDSGFDKSMDLGVNSHDMTWIYA